MDFQVLFTDSEGKEISEETFVGVTSLAALFLILSRSWELTDKVAEVIISRLGEKDG